MLILISCVPAQILNLLGNKVYDPTDVIQNIRDQFQRIHLQSVF